MKIKMKHFWADLVNFHKKWSASPVLYYVYIIVIIIIIIIYTRAETKKEKCIKIMHRCYKSKYGYDTRVDCYLYGRDYEKKLHKKKIN